MNNKIDHLKLIQCVVERMAKNSFFLKSLAASATTVIVGFSLNDSHLVYVLILCVPLLSFWFLDAFFLKREKMFRNFYDEVRKKSEKEIDFSLNPNNTEDFFGVLFSDTLLLFYGALFVTLALVYFFTF